MQHPDITPEPIIIACREELPVRKRIDFPELSRSIQGMLRNCQSVEIQFDKQQSTSMRAFGRQLKERNWKVEIQAGTMKVSHES